METLKKDKKSEYLESIERKYTEEAKSYEEKGDKYNADFLRRLGKIAAEFASENYDKKHGITQQNIQNTGNGDKLAS